MRKQLLIMSSVEHQSHFPEPIIRLFSTPEFDLIDDVIDLHQRFDVFVLCNGQLLNATSQKLISPFEYNLVLNKQLILAQNEIEQLTKSGRYEKAYIYIDSENDEDVEHLGLTLVNNVKQLKQIVKKPSIAHSFNFNDLNIYRSGISGLTDLKGMVRANQRIGASLAYVNSDNPKLLNAFLSLLENERCFLDNGIVTYNGKAAKKKGNIPTPKEIFLQYKAIIDKLSPQEAKNLQIVIVDDIVDQQAAENILRENKELILYLIERTDVMLPIHKCHIYKNKSLLEHARTMLEILDFPQGLRLAVPTKKRLSTGLGDVFPRLEVSEINDLLAIQHQGVNFFRKVHFLALTECSDNDKYEFPLFMRLLACADSNVIDVSLDGQRLSALFGGKNSKRKGTLIQDIIRKRKRERVIKNDPYFINFSDKWTDEPTLYEFILSVLERDHEKFKTEFNTIIASPKQGIDKIVGDTLSQIELEIQSMLVDMPTGLVVELEQRVKSHYWHEIIHLRPFHDHFSLSSKDREDAICSLFSQSTSELPRKSTIPCGAITKRQQNLIADKERQALDLEVSRSIWMKGEGYYQSFN
ncbi:hypothetical protein [Photobacterium leiognathi]|uniref:hypothetical protein n=1 Tax=Photobacterium leiognathi TaxID=553611 RepID=UPI0029825EC8|nr:hypothetical protein [Photobacterium leiognathi]